MVRSSLHDAEHVQRTRIVSASEEDDMYLNANSGQSGGRAKAAVDFRMQRTSSYGGKMTL